MTPKIDIRGVHKLFASRHHQVEALRDVSLTVDHNEFVALVGASGCGKSTLLRIVGGLESLTSGERNNFV